MQAINQELAMDWCKRDDCPTVCRITLTSNEYFLSHGINDLRS